MSTIITNRLSRFSIALTGIVSLFSGTYVFADANDDISNKATLQYSVGGALPIVIESSQAGNSTPGLGNGTDTVFKEDRLINFVVANSGATGNVTPGDTLQATEFLVTNNSNTALDFLLLGLNNVDGTADPFGGAAVDEFDGLVIQTFVESGVTVGFQAAEDTATFITGLAEGANQIVYVVATIPLVDSTANPLINGNIATMTLVAQPATGGVGDGTGAIMRDDNGNVSPGGLGFNNGAATLTTVTAVNAVDNPAVMDTVFNEPTGSQDGTGAADTDRNGQHSADSSYTIQTAELTVTKIALAHFDDINQNINPKAIPGAVVRYTITIENAAGGAVATLTDVSDVLAMLMDNQFGDTDVVNSALSGTNNVRITDGASTVTFCQADNADANGDGCTWNGTAGDTLTVDLSVVAGITDQLLAGQTLTIEFDVIVP